MKNQLGSHVDNLRGIIEKHDQRIGRRVAQAAKNAEMMMRVLNNREFLEFKKLLGGMEGGFPFIIFNAPDPWDRKMSFDGRDRVSFICLAFSDTTRVNNKGQYGRLLLAHGNPGTVGHRWHENEIFQLLEQARQGKNTYDSGVKSVEREAIDILEPFSTEKKAMVIVSEAMKRKVRSIDNVLKRERKTLNV